jgi:hypothetical protein
MTPNSRNACALFALLLPGFLLLWFNLIPLFNRGSEFQVHPDGSVSVLGAPAGNR